MASGSESGPGAHRPSATCGAGSPGVGVAGTRDLADYLIPTATDFPKVRAIALENHRSPSNPLGVKGAGEGAIIPIGGLMANAVANALASFGRSATPRSTRLSRP